MAERPFEPAELEALRRWDTPTICNASLRSTRAAPLSGSDAASDSSSAASESLMVMPFCALLRMYFARAAVNSNTFATRGTP